MADAMAPRPAGVLLVLDPAEADALRRMVRRDFDRCVEIAAEETSPYGAWRRAFLFRLLCALERPGATK